MLKYKIIRFQIIIEKRVSLVSRVFKINTLFRIKTLSFLLSRQFIQMCETMKFKTNPLKATYIDSGKK